MFREVQPRLNMTLALETKNRLFLQLDHRFFLFLQITDHHDLLLVFNKIFIFPQCATLHYPAD